MTRSAAMRHNLGSRGFALMVVIVVLLFASFLASTLTLQLRAEQQTAFNAASRTSGRFLAEAGVQLALFRLLDTPLIAAAPQDEKMVPGVEYATTLRTGTVRYVAVNEGGKIDANNAPRPLLVLFLRYHGFTAAEAASFADALGDWRDDDDFLRLHGAEKDYYQNLSQPYLPRNGEIAEPAELLLLRGADRLAGKFEPEEVFTVYNPQGKINANHLTPAMLAFVMEGDSARMQAFREAQQTYKVIDKALARQLIGDQRYAELEPYLTFDKDGGTSHYEITAIGRPLPSREGAAPPPGVKTTTLVRIFGDTYQFVLWKEGGA
ncbi:MAG: hypothetical protein AB1413_02580 [Thermodesulfobacteriota bacterium]